MCHVQSTSYSSRVEEPWLSFVLPHGSDEFIGIGRVHDQIGDSGFIVHKKNFLPGFTAIGSFENTAFRMFSPWRPNGSYVNGVGVGGVDNHSVDVPGFFQAHGFPTFSAIQGFVDAITSVQTVSRVTFACPHPNDGWIGLLDGHGTDGSSHFIIKNGLPFDTPRGRFPQTARSGSDKHDIWIGMDHIDRSYTSAHSGRTYVSWFHVLNQIHAEFLC